MAEPVEEKLYEKLLAAAKGVLERFLAATADGKLTLGEMWQVACEFVHAGVTIAESFSGELTGPQKRAAVERAFGVLFDAAWPKVATLGGLWWLRFVPAPLVRHALVALIGGPLEAACRRLP